jgi:hypothetical protein
MKRDDVPYRLPDHQRASARATAAFATLPYPISKDELLEAVGDWGVPLPDGQSVPLGRLLMNAPVDAFESPEDAMHAFDAHWGRAWSGLDVDER